VFYLPNQKPWRLVKEILKSGKVSVDNNWSVKEREREIKRKDPNIKGRTRKSGKKIHMELSPSELNTERGMSGCNSVFPTLHKEGERHDCTWRTEGYPALENTRPWLLKGSVTKQLVKKSNTVKTKEGPWS